MLKKLLLFLLFFVLLTCSKEEEDSSSVNTVTVEQPVEVQVTKYTLTLTAGEGGSVTGGGTYDDGTNITITATPSEGYEFVGWEGREETTSELTITLNSDVSLNALFQSSLVSEIIGKWDFSSETEKNNCTVISIIFSVDLSFKLYTQNAVILGNFSVSQGTISLLVGSNSVGTIAGVTVSGTSLSATFNINGYCLAVQAAQKNTTYTPAKTYVPDDNFEQYLIDAGFDDVLDDYVLTSNINTIDVLPLCSTSRNIKSIRGVEDFVELKRVNFSNNEIKSANLSNNLKLESIYLNNNMLESIDISLNNALKSFSATGNPFQVTSIDISNNINLNFFAIGGTKSEGAGNTFCANGKIISFVSKIKESEITSIDFSNNSKLTQLIINDSKLVDFDVSGYNNLVNIGRLNLTGNNITSIDLSGFTELEQLYLGTNQLTSLDISMLSKLNNQGGNGGSIFIASRNPYLACIKVSQSQLDFLPDKQWRKDSSAVYSLDCTSDIYLDTNGVTIKCQNAFIGFTKDVNGKTYEVVDNASLRAKADNDEDVTCVCTSNVTDMSLLFQDKPNFNQNIESWDTSSVTNFTMMFARASSFNQNISNWNTSNIEITHFMFLEASAFNQDIGNWDMSNNTFANSMFRNATSFNKDISNWNTSKITNMAQMFRGAISFNQDIGSWDTSSVNKMDNMFREATAFNQDIGNWNTAAVTNMQGMFYNTTFNQDIGNWNTAAVTNMSYMFFGTAFNQDIGSWNTSSVTNMRGMFQGATAFNGDIGTWNTAAVTNMYAMFYNTSTFNQDIGSWNTAAVTDMRFMFQGATAFNQDLTSWCVTNLVAEPASFTTFSALTNANKPVWGTCPTSSSTTGASYSLDVTASNSSDYTLSGTDRNGNISGNDPNLTFSVGDTINFVVNAAGHPFYLKTTAGTGTGNTISGITNNGTTNQTISWTPTSAGTFYYQCSLHGGMVGTITIQ